MSEENKELVRRAIEANRSGPPEETIDRALAFVGEDFEFLSRLVSVEGASYRGHDGVRAYFRDLSDAFQEWRNEVNELREIGPETIFMDLTFYGTARSGVEVELRSAGVVLLSRGRFLRMDVYPSRQEALAAAGLSE